MHHQLVRVTSPGHSLLHSLLPSASDCPKLQSLLYFPHSFPGCSLLAHPQGLYALSYEPAEGFARFTVYGRAESTHGYADAAQQLLSLADCPALNGSAIPSEAVTPLTDTLRQHGWARTYHNPCLQFTYGPSTDAPQTPHIPRGYVLDTLRQSDAELVDSLWPFRSATSLAMVRELITSSHTSCIRLQQDSSPPGQQPAVAWMLEVEPLCGGMLHVLDQHRGQGLAKAVCRDLFSKLHAKWQAVQTQQQQQQQEGAAAVEDGVSAGAGHAVYCYVVQGNTASIRLMEGLGLQPTGVFTWLGFERRTGGPE